LTIMYILVNALPTPSHATLQPPAITIVRLGARKAAAMPIVTATEHAN
jgi:hypothetical protein